MKEWFEPDDTWYALGHTTKEDYLHEFVVRGRFHSMVPRDILEAYNTVEYLMAHAYCHYPMYDEAVKKLLGIFEMAVKFRCEQLNISKTLINASNQTRVKTLNTLIASLAEKEPLKNLKTKLDHIRELRNIEAHPKQHSFMGGLKRQVVIPVINIINSLFLEEKEIERNLQKGNQLSEKYINYKNGLYILDDGLKRILITDFQLLTTIEVKKELYSIWLCSPVLNNAFENISNQLIDNPVVLGLKNIHLEKQTIQAIDLETQNKIRITPTDKLENILLLQKFNTEIASLTVRDQAIFQTIQENYINRRVDEFIYKNRVCEILPT